MPREREVTYEIPKAEEVKRWLLENRSDLAPATHQGVDASEDLLKNTLGILIGRAPTFRKIKFLGVPIRTTQLRRPFVGRVNTKEDTWELEVFGEKNKDLLIELAGQLKEKFKVSIKASLKLHESLTESFHEDFYELP